MLAIVLISILLIILLVIVVNLYDRKSTRQKLKKEFNIEGDFKILQADIGRKHGLSSKMFFVDGVSGKPDILFRKEEVYIVGELKSAKMKQTPRKRDVYQLMIYMGAIKKQNPKSVVEGRLKYANTIIHYEFDEALYHYILGFQPECLALLNKARV